MATNNILTFLCSQFFHTAYASTLRAMVKDVIPASFLFFSGVPVIDAGNFGSPSHFHLILQH
jgi:hypothetical protein